MDNRIASCQRVWTFNGRHQLDGLWTPNDRIEYAPQTRMVHVSFLFLFQWTRAPRMAHQEQLGCDVNITFNVTSSVHIWGSYLLGALCQNCHRGNDDLSHLFAIEGTSERRDISFSFEGSVLR